MSNYTPIIENAQPVTHYNFNDDAIVLTNENSPHRYWRFGQVSLSNNGNMSIQDIDLWEYTENSIHDISPSNSVIITSDVAPSSGLAANLWDSGNHTSWGGGVYPVDITIEFPNSVTVGAFRFNIDLGSWGPTNTSLEFSDDGVTWTKIDDYILPLSSTTSTYVQTTFNIPQLFLRDNVNSLDIEALDLVTTQQPGALLGETDNKAIAITGVLETANTLDTSTFGTEFACEMFLKPDSEFVLNIGDSFRVALNENQEIVLNRETWNQRGSMLIGPSGDNFGKGVAVSNDAKVLVVGAWGYNSGRGSLYTYDRSGDTWIQRGSILIGTTSSLFGAGCSLSGNGEVLTVGAWAYSSSDTGAVYTYDRSGDTWIQRGSILQASDIGNGDYFGYSTSLSDDGNVLVVGAVRHETTGSDTGAVYTYDRSGDTWIQRGLILQASDIGNVDLFGSSCSLSSNATVLVVGAANHETTGSDTGAVYTYDRSGDTWIQRGLILQASDIGNDDRFGNSCSLSSNANTLIIGATGGDKVYIYDIGTINKELIKDTWNQLSVNYSNNSISVYNNGNIIYSEPYTYVFNATSYIRIQGDANIDELAVYDRILSDYEIISHYNNSRNFDITESSILNSNPLVYYGMNDINSQMNSDIGYIEGNYFNNPTLSNNNGKHGDCVLFDGINQYGEVGEQGDEYFDYVVLLMHFNGVTFRDDSKYFNISSMSGDTHISTVQGKFNQSVLFDGVGDSIAIPSIPEFNLTYNDFTIEAFINHTDLTGPQSIVAKWFNFNREFAFRHGNGTFVFEYSIDGNSNIILISEPTSIVINNWYHLAVTRRGGVIRGFIDGVQIGSDYDIGNDVINVSATTPINIGGEENNSYGNFKGYIDELRITNGVARYTENFTPPTKEFQNNQKVSNNWDFGVETDLFYENVELLLHFDGDNGSTIFKDSSKRNQIATVVGNTNISNNGYFNQAAYFDGNGDYLSYSNSNGLFRFNVDFTIEMWFKVLSWDSGISNYLVFNRDTAPLIIELSVANPTHIIKGSMWDSGGAYYVIGESTTEIQLDTWYHFAISKNDNICRLFVNGVQESQYNNLDVGNVNDSSLFNIGGSATNVDRYLHGYIDEFRYTRGVGRYTENFAVQTKPFSAFGSSNMSNSAELFDDYYNNVNLLIHMDGVDGANVFNDDSNKGLNIISGGDVKTSSDKYKFNNSSAYFDGTSDYLQMANSPLLEFDIDHTIEFWINVSGWSSGATNYIILQRGGTDTLAISIANPTHTLRWSIWNLAGGAVSYGSTTEEIQLNQWYCVALSKIGTNHYLFINGELVSTVVTSDVPKTTGSDPFEIGGSPASNADRFFNGYIDEFRFTSGIGRYSGNYIPQLKAFYDTVHWGSTNVINGFNESENYLEYDPYWNNVGLLIHFDGYNGTTVFHDSSKNDHTITKFGQARITLDSYKFNSSGYFDGSGDYLRLPYGAGLDFVDGTTHFTVEFWINLGTSPAPTGRRLISLGGGGVNFNNGGIHLLIQSYGAEPFNIIYQMGLNSTSSGGTTSTVTSDTWNHVALTFDGISTRLFLNGVLENTDTVVVTRPTGTPIFEVGHIYGESGNSSMTMHGYMEDLRVSKGVARYTENFIPQNKPFSEAQVVLTNTGKLRDMYYDKVSLLLHMNGEVGSRLFTDNSKYSTNVASYGNAKIASEGVFNQSVLFEPGGFITYQPTNQHHLFDEDFTVECFVKPTAYNPNTSRIYYVYGDTYTGASFGISAAGFVNSYGSSTGSSWNMWAASDVAGIVTLNQWSHIALCRHGTDITIFLNGIGYSIANSLTESTKLYETPHPLTIGGQLGADRGLRGYIDEFRVTKGIARYIENFTPPTLEFANKYETLAMTQECWFNAVSVTTGSYNTIFSKGSEVQNSLVIQDSTFTSNGDINYYYTETDKVTFNTSLGLNTWNHIVITQTNYETTIYLNGIEVASKIAPTQVSNENFFIASDNQLTYASNIYVDGYIIADRLFTRQEIQDRFNAYQGLSINKDYYDTINALEPIRYYKLNDIDNIVIDSVDRNNAKFSVFANYETKQSSLILADFSNKSVLFTDANVDLNDSLTGLTNLSISLNIKFLQLPTSNLDIVQSLGGDATYIYYNSSTNTLSSRSTNGGVNDSGFSPIVNQTYNVAITVTPTAIKWYIDGTFLIENVTTTDVATVYRFKGENAILDEFLIFDKILTAQEIEDLYVASKSSLYTKYSYENLVANADHYYKLNDINTTIVDAISGYNGTISGNTYTQDSNSLLQSDVSNKATNFTDAVINFTNYTSFGATYTIAFLMTVNSVTSGNIIRQIVNGGLILDVNGSIKANNSTGSSDNLFTPEIGKSYHYVFIFDNTENFIHCYVNGKLESVVNFDMEINGFSSISEAGNDIKLDEIVIYDTHALLEHEITELYSRATYELNASIGWHITGVTQVAGLNTSVDLRLFHHDTGGLITQITSDPTGYYNFTGLYEGVRYDVVAWQEADITTCQHINMGVLPESYTF